MKQFYENSNLKIRYDSFGIYMFNRVTGTNVLFDEIHLPSSCWATAPRQVSIAVTNNCDLSCPHCYASKKPVSIPFENLTEWLIDLDRNGCIGVGFGGGEPTLYPHLSELCSFTVKKTRLAVTMTTHAHRLTNELLDKLTGNIHFIRVSMDGIGSTYETIRGRPFDALIERIKRLRRFFSFGINYVINSRTVKELDDAVKLASDLGASEFLLLPEEPIGRGKGIDDETNVIFKQWVNKYSGKLPLTTSEGRTDGLPVCDPFPLETGLAAFSHIDATGVMKRTSFDVNGVSIEGDQAVEAVMKLRTNEFGVIK